MMLLIDIGNTRLKWAQFANDRLGEQSAITHAELTREQLIAPIIATSAPPERVLIANVGGARIGDLAAQCVRDHWGVEAEFVHSTASAGGVRNAYREPAKLGVDRWMAIIGAYAIEKRAVCVASVGTAMTIDAVDAGGRHRGGVIVPGPDLMVASLFRNTSEIAWRAQQGESTAGLFADNTRGAVEQGAVHALAALIERAFATLGQEVGEAPALILTGGASSRFEGLLYSPFSVVPDLVLQGLAVAAKDSG
jgi:type III pantothenate kinase